MKLILAPQFLQLALAAFGAVLGSVAADLLGRANPLSGWILLASTFLLVCAFAAQMVIYERELDALVRRVGAALGTEIDAGMSLEYDIRAQKFANAEELVPRIEDWRTRVNDYLKRELPESGADIRFRAGLGVIGRGEFPYEHERLRDLNANLRAVLDSLPSYARRSREQAR